MSDRPSYLRVLQTFARNSLVRDMTFRANFLIEAITSIGYVLLQLGFYILVYQHTGSIADWDRYQFFVFMATTLLVNSLMQTFFMPNATEFSELIRVGGLDFALLKPIDTQFLVSLHRIQWSALGNFAFGFLLLIYSLVQLHDQSGYVPSVIQVVLYPFYVVCGVVILYSLMFAMAATSIWFGRNQNLYDFWFYITSFSRYPMEIYEGRFGTPLRLLFTYLIPVLIVVNVPAHMMARPLDPGEISEWFLPVVALVLTALSFAASRLVFTRSLMAYRSASS